jgi:hypothetical protein
MSECSRDSVGALVCFHSARHLFFRRKSGYAAQSTLSLAGARHGLPPVHTAYRKQRSQWPVPCLGGAAHRSCPLRKAALALACESRAELAVAPNQTTPNPVGLAVADRASCGCLMSVVPIPLSGSRGASAVDKKTASRSRTLQLAVLQFCVVVWNRSRRLCCRAAHSQGCSGLLYIEARARAVPDRAGRLFPG